MQANAQTTMWVDAEAKRLLRQREACMSELKKFCDVSKTMAKLGYPQLYLIGTQQIITPRPPTGGTGNLARLVAEISAMQSQLSVFTKTE